MVHIPMRTPNWDQSEQLQHLIGSMPSLAVIVVVALSCLYAAEAIAPVDSVLVFSRGEGGYYCHKIPYLLRTLSGVLLAFAEGRGKDGRDTCDDFNVSVMEDCVDCIDCCGRVLTL